MLRLFCVSLLVAGTVFATPPCPPKVESRGRIWVKRAIVGITLGAAAWTVVPVLTPDPAPRAVIVSHAFPDPLGTQTEALTNLTAQLATEAPPGFQIGAEPRGAPLGFAKGEATVGTQAKPRTLWERVRQKVPERIPAHVRTGHVWRFLLAVPLENSETQEKRTELVLAESDLSSGMRFTRPSLRPLGSFALSPSALTEEDLGVSVDAVLQSRSKDEPPAVTAVRESLASQTTDRGFASMTRPLEAALPQVSSDPASRYYVVSFFHVDKPGRMELLVHVLGGKAWAYDLASAD